MQAQKQMHASQLWQQGLNDILFSHVIPLIEAFNVTCSL